MVSHCFNISLLKGKSIVSRFFTGWLFFILPLSVDFVLLSSSEALFSS